MALLVLFAFLGGIVTILSPCILPIAPLVFASSLSGGKGRPLGVAAGFIASFTLFTLFLSAIVKATGISPDAVRFVAVILISLFGLTLVVPAFSRIFEKLASRLASFAPSGNSKREGFLGGLVAGVSIGLIWTPCVGPILGAVISLALTGAVTGNLVLIMFAYALGTSIPLFALIYGGRTLLSKFPWLISHTSFIQKIFGVIMILTALAMTLNLDRKFQTYIVQTFPSYGAGLTHLEDTAGVQEQLKKLEGKESTPSPSQQTQESTSALPKLGTAPELILGGEWFNSPPLSLAGLRGKVVLVDFWTYTCINCIRTLPYIERWYETYRDKGFVVIGVHTPEFEFEKNPENVKNAIKDFGLTYPVMQDNAYATWNAYDNHYWPAKYLIDKDGVVRSVHFGEGDYDETERAIVSLLNEQSNSKIETVPQNPEYRVETRTPETYVGYGRMEYFGSPEKIQKDAEARYTIPSDLPMNRFALGGTWDIEAERAIPKKGSKLALHFDARKVFLVMRPRAAPGKVKVRLDAVPLPLGNAGEDAKDTVVTVDTDRLYRLISLPQAGPHMLLLEFLDDNVEVYAFTFG